MTWPKLCPDLSACIGHLGDTITTWDNGFYANCTTLEISAAFLVDSGSTATLVSTRVFQYINKEQRPSLVPVKDKICGVNGNDNEIRGVNGSDNDNKIRGVNGSDNEIRGVNGSDNEVLSLADIPLELGSLLFPDSHNMQHTSRWCFGSGLHASLQVALTTRKC